MIQRYFWLAYLILITLAAALGADMTVSYLENRLSQTTISEEGPSAQTTQDTVSRPAEDYEVIAKRNIFNAEPPSEIPQIQCSGPNPDPKCDCNGLNPHPNCPAKCPGSPGCPPAPPPAPTPLELKLTGTVTSGDGPNYAFIEDKAKRGHQQLYQVGDTIQNRIIVNIRNDCVILEQNGKREQLCFPNRQESAAATPARPSASGAAANAEDEDSNEDVVQVDDATWRIRRELIQEQFADLGGLGQQARVTPYIVQGETRGFRVTRLKANSLLQKIGLQHGDVLQKVNGSSLTSPADALQAYQQLQQGGTVRLEILRRDRASTLTYEIR